MNENDDNHGVNSTIQRWPHDARNPYTQILNDLIRDDSVSPNCRLILIGLLSNKDGWVISIPQLVSQYSNHFGREKVYSLVKEAVTSGYMKREQIRTGGKWQTCKYYIAERPVFKESLPNTGFQNTENRNSENQHIKKEQELKKEQDIKKEQQQHSVKTASIISPTSSPLSVAVSSDQSKKEQKRDPSLLIQLRDLKLTDFTCNELWNKYDDETVRDAIAYATHPSIRIKNTIPACIVWACEKKPEIPKNVETPYEVIKKKFKHGEIYNNAVCYLDEKSIAFERGITHDQLPLDKYFTWKKFKNLCEKFQINIKEIK